MVHSSRGRSGRGGGGTGPQRCTSDLPDNSRDLSTAPELHHDTALVEGDGSGAPISAGRVRRGWFCHIREMRRQAHADELKKLKKTWRHSEKHLPRLYQCAGPQRTQRCGVHRKAAGADSPVVLLLDDLNGVPLFQKGYARGLLTRKTFPRGQCHERLTHRQHANSKDVGSARAAI